MGRVIDTSGYFPRMVRASAELLGPNVKQYVFISSISVYVDNSVPNYDETAAVHTLKDPASEDLDLVAAILSGKRIAVSTGTKTLQDQIFDHDIPVLRQLLFPQLRAVVLKGRKNYLCRRRLSQFAVQPSFAAREEAKLFQRLLGWASRSETGDRAEIPWLPDQFLAWNEISSSSDQCLGQECPDQSRCFLTRLRQQAARAHLLLVNHHLLFADLAVRRGGYGEVIPRYEAVIFDEAHQLEDVAASYFGIHGAISVFKNCSMTPRWKLPAPPRTRRRSGRFAVPANTWKS